MEVKKLTSLFSAALDNSGVICALLLWISSLALYVYTLYPAIPGGDSGKSLWYYCISGGNTG